MINNGIPTTKDTKPSVSIAIAGGSKIKDKIKKVQGALSDDTSDKIKFALNTERFINIIRKSIFF